jgi:arginine-tRNA-protein transferase
LADKTARSQVATPAHLIHADLYSELVSSGFRRSGLYTYRPYCDHCKLCVPCRVNAQLFIPKRHQQRAYKKHQGLIASVNYLEYHEEHYQLYLQYQKTRHQGGGMDSDDQDQYRQFLLQSKVNTRLIEFREGPNSSDPGKLRIVCIIDIVNDGLSSVYTFFDSSDTRASYGNYAILWQIEQVKKLQLPYLYLGYYIQDSPKMSYKVSFEPIEVLQEDRWQPYNPTITHL